MGTNRLKASADKETTSSTNNPRYSGVFVVEVVKLYFYEEVEVRGYTGIIVCSTKLIESRLPTEGQVACLGGVFCWETPA